MVKRVDPTHTDKEANIRHPQFLDIVDLYDVFLHARFNRETYGIVTQKLTDNQVHMYVRIKGLCFLKPLDEASYEFLIEWVVDPRGAKKNEAGVTRTVPSLRSSPNPVWIEKLITSK